MAKLTFAEVDALLKYEPETGKLFWKERPRHLSVSDRAHSIWTAKYAGKEAFTSTDSTGYKQGRISSRKYYAHRIIWLLLTGQWPDKEIDHINGVRDDNRRSNLRSANSSQNGRNKAKRSDNKTGVTGVCWNKVTGKWLVQAGSPKTSVFRKEFDAFSDAVEARKKVDAEMGFHPNHGR